MSYQRQDRRTPASKDWGKQQVEYPHSDLAFPTIIETKTARQSENPPATGTAHPDTTHFPGALLVGVHTEPGENRDVNWWLTYETVPGPTIHSTRIDDDGVPVDVATTRMLAAAIVTAETLPGGTPWTKTTAQQTEDNDFLANRIVETRAIPGPPIYSKKVGLDGNILTTSTAKKAIANITASEVITGSNLVQTRMERMDSALVALEIIESRPLPGNPIYSTRLDWDGVQVIEKTTLKDATTITTHEVISGSNWIRTRKKDVPGTSRLEVTGTSLVANEVVDTRPATGNPAVPFDKLDPLDQVKITGTRTLDLISNIVPNVQESVSGSNWLRTYLEPVEGSDLVAHQITESRVIIGPIVAEDGRPDFDGLTIDTSRQLVALGSITEGEDISGPTWRRLFGRQHLGSSIVALQFIESRLATGNAISLPTETLEAGDVVISTSQLVPLPITASEAVVGGNWVWTFGKPHESSVVGLLITESRPVPGNTDRSEVYREAGAVVIMQRQLVEQSAAVASDIISGGTAWIREFYEKHSESILVVWQMTESRPLSVNPLVTKERDPDGAEVVVTKTLEAAPVTTNDSITSNVWTRILEEPIADTSAVCWKLVRVRAVNIGHAPTLTTYESDPETFDPITVSKTIVAASTATANNAANQETTYTAINAVVSLKTVRTINSGSAPTGRTEYRISEYSFPRRLYNVVFAGAVDNYGNAFITYNPVAAAAQRPKTIFKVVVSYVTSFTPSVGSYHSFILQAVNYSGLFLNVHEGDVINDAIGPVTYTTASDNPRWTSITDSFSFNASTPYSASGYNALKGSYLLVSAQFSPWKFNIYRQELIYVLVPNES